MELLRGMEPRLALQLSDDLCIYSINILNKESNSLMPLPRDGNNTVNAFQ